MTVEATHRAYVPALHQLEATAAAPATVAMAAALQSTSQAQTTMRETKSSLDTSSTPRRIEPVSSRTDVVVQAEDGHSTVTLYDTRTGKPVCQIPNEQVAEALTRMREAGD